MQVSKINSIVTKYNPSLVTIPMMQQDDINTLCAVSYDFKIQPYMNTQLKPVYNVLISQLFQEKSKTRKTKNDHLPMYDLEVQSLVYGSSLALKKGFAGIKWSFSFHAFTTLNTVQKREGDEKITLEKSNHVINTMIENGYLVKFTGGIDFYKDDVSYKSVLLFTEKYLNLFEGVGFDKIKNVDSNQWFELRLRDTKSVLAVDNEVSFEGNAIYKRAITNLNKLCSSHIIKMNNEIWRPRYNAVGIKEENSNDFKGMRIYGGNFQTQPSGKKEKDQARGYGRNTLTIDNVGCVEVDFNGMHLAIAYTLANKTMPKDPYAIDYSSVITLKEDSDKARKQARTLLKVATLISINAKDIASAISAVRSKLNKHSKTEYSLIEVSNIGDVIELIISNHPTIKESFCSDKGVDYQVIDGMIAARVIDHFTKKGVVCLPWHDSFVIQYQYEQELKDVMVKSWKAVLRGVKNCSVSVEFCNNTNNVPSEKRHIEMKRFDIASYEHAMLEIPLSAYTNDEIQCEPVQHVQHVQGVAVASINQAPTQAQPQQAPTIEQTFEYDEDYMFWMNLCIEEEIENLPF